MGVQTLESRSESSSGAACQKMCGQTVPVQRELLVNTGCGDCHRHPVLPAAQALLLLIHPDTSVPK